MTNEEKILQMLTQMQADINELKEKVNSQNVTLQEEKRLRQIDAFNKFINSKTDAEEPEATEEFFRIMDAEEARKAEF